VSSFSFNSNPTVGFPPPDSVVVAVSLAGTGVFVRMKYFALLWCRRPCERYSVLKYPSAYLA